MKKKKHKQNIVKVEYILYAILFLIGVLLLKYITSIALILIFAALSFILVKISIRVEHVTFDCFSATTIFFGYLFGPLVGIIYGILVGIVSYSAARLNQFTISNILLAIISAILINFINGPFSKSFIIVCLIRICMDIPWFMLLGSNFFENITQTSSLALINIFIYLPFLNLILKLTTIII